MLLVYVDDFKLAAKAELHDKLCAEIWKVIDMDPETLDGRFLGCTHERCDTVASKLEGMLDNHPVYRPRPSLASNHKRRLGVTKTKVPSKPTRTYTIPTKW